MGANFSKSDQKILFDASTSVVTQVLTKFQNTHTNNVNTNQMINFYIGKNAHVECSGDFTSRQFSNTLFSAIMNASSQDKTELSNEITKELTAKITSMIDQGNTGINFGQANVNWSSSEVRQKVATIINTSTSTTIETSLQNNINNTQGQNFTVGDGSYLKGQNCDLSQDSTTQMLSQMITTNIAENLISNVDKSVLSGDSQLQVTQKNEGINWPWIGGGIFGVIGFCLIVFIIIKSMKKKKGEDG